MANIYQIVNIHFFRQQNPFLDFTLSHYVCIFATRLNNFDKLCFTYQAR